MNMQWTMAGTCLEQGGIDSNYDTGHNLLLKVCMPFPPTSSGSLRRRLPPSRFLLYNGVKEEIKNSCSVYTQIHNAKG